MTWVYQQSTGNLYRNGQFVVKGYAGKEKGKFNPDMQGVADIGPLPRGKYTIVGHPFKHPHTGMYSMRLQPDRSNIMYGRLGFLIHGDKQSDPGNASNGCIVVSMPTRQAIWASGDRQVEVVR